MSEILAAALDHAAKGRPVFPCKPDKTPLTPNGFKDATCDPIQIKKWWKQHPNALIGMPTGPASGIAVLDLDVKKGKNGFIAVPDWEARTPVISRTGSGGAHLFFRSENAPHCTSDVIALGVDTRGDGGYVIVPPSAGYAWVNGHDFATLPPWPDDLRPPSRAADAMPGDDPEADPALVALAMTVIPNDDLGWDEWNSIGMAVWRATGGRGFAAFDNWSQKSKKYDAAETARRWAHYFKSPPTQIGVGTLFFMANEASTGWDDAYYAEFEAHINDGGSDDVEAWLKANVWGEDEVAVDPPEQSQVNDNDWMAAALAWQAHVPKPKPTSPEPPSWRQSIPLIDISKWDDEPVPQQDWAVPDRIPIGKTTLFSGEGAAGKSLIQLHLSVAHVLGREWLGTKPQQGPALFLDAEDDEQVIHKRLADILRHYGARFEDVKNDLHLVSLAGRDAVLGVFNRRAARIQPTTLYTQLVEMVGDLKPKMIGIASSADVFAGNEIDRSQVQQFVGLLTRLAMVANSGLTLIAHPSLTGISTDTGLSGTTQWHNSVRARFYLKGVKSENDDWKDANVREIVFKKNNYGPISSNIILQYQYGLFLPLAGISSLDQAERDQQIDEIFLKAMTNFIGQNYDLGISKNGANYAPTMIAKHPSAKGIRKDELEAAQQRLIAANKIHIKTEGPASKQRKRLVLGPATEEDDPM